jgi:hypothetical protein
LKYEHFQTVHIPVCPNQFRLERIKLRVWPVVDMIV